MGTLKEIQYIFKIKHILPAVLLTTYLVYIWNVFSSVFVCIFFPRDWIECLLLLQYVIILSYFIDQSSSFNLENKLTVSSRWFIEINNEGINKQIQLHSYINKSNNLSKIFRRLQTEQTNPGSPKRAHISLCKTIANAQRHQTDAISITETPFLFYYIF